MSDTQEEPIQEDTTKPYGKVVKNPITKQE